MLISLNQQLAAGIKLHFTNPDSEFKVGVYVYEYPVHPPRYNRTDLCIESGQGGFIETLDIPFDRLGFLYHAPGNNRTPSTADIFTLYDDNDLAEDAVLVYVCNHDAWSELVIKIYNSNPRWGCEDQIRSIYCRPDSYRVYGRTTL